MIDLATLPLTTMLPACFAGGVLLGYAYFYALYYAAKLIVSGGHPVLGLGLALGRVGLIGAGFYVAVLGGAVALIATLAGVLCGKLLLLYQTRKLQT